jgi:hypothetical protein
LPSTNKDIIIKDSCILFDLLDLALLDDFFKLPLQAHTTLQVIGEVIDEEQRLAVNKHVSEGRIKIDGDGAYEVIAAIMAASPGLSFTDGSVLELADRMQAVILSADGILRKIGRQKNFTVRGTLWVIEEMCNKQILSAEAAIAKLELYPKINERVPKLEITALITKLKEK